MSNTLRRRQILLGASGMAGMAGLSAWPLAALAQQSGWPVKPVTTIVPFPAGGGTDALARVVAHVAALDRRFRSACENWTAVAAGPERIAIVGEQRVRGHALRALQNGGFLIGRRLQT